MKLTRTIGMVALGTISSVMAEGSLQRTLKAFEDKPGYVQPLATWFGSFTNSGWATSARVNRGFGWEFALPVVGIAYLDPADHTYTSSFDDGCADVNAAGFDCPSTSYEVPTIMGPQTNVEYTRYMVDPSGQSYVSMSGGFADDGDETLRKISTLGTAWVQTSFSYEHAKLILRGAPFWWLSDGEFQGYNHLGFALQYSLGHYFAQYLPPAYPVDVSLLTSYNFITIGYSPKDYSGELNLDITSMWHALVVGTRLGSHFEVFTELGYETSTLKSSGSLVAKVEGEDDINPRVQVDGRNGFKASFNIALHFGSYHPAVAMSQGAQTANSFNIMNFGKEGTP